MRHLLFTATAAALTLSAAITIESSPAKADGARFCISGRDGGGIENCSFATLRSCKATTSGNSGSCILNPNYEGDDYGYDYGYGPGVAVQGPPVDSYAYAPGPVYGPRYGYAYSQRYVRPGFGVYINGY